MRFVTVFASAAAVISVGAVPTAEVTVAEKRSSDISISLNLGNLFPGFDLSKSNHYGAPIPPWEPKCQPGWYYGSNPRDHPDLPCLGGTICKILELVTDLIQCPSEYPPPSPPQYPPPPPTPSDGFTPTFTNITAAVQADDYITFGLVDTVADCKAMCKSVKDCNFVNTYHDVNGKDGSTELTCALFQKCHGPEDADNRGGQTQSDGTVDYIIDSDGYCKDS